MALAIGLEKETDPAKVKQLLVAKGFHKGTDAYNEQFALWQESQQPKVVEKEAPSFSFTYKSKKDEEDDGEV